MCDCTCNTFIVNVTNDNRKIPSFFSVYILGLLTSYWRKLELAYTYTVRKIGGIQIRVESIGEPSSECVTWL